MKNQMMFQIDKLKLHTYFVFDALCIDRLMSIFFDYISEIDD